MNLDKIISDETKVAAERVGFNEKNYTIGTLYQWINNNHHINIIINYNDDKLYGYILKNCEGYGIPLQNGSEFLYIDDNSFFDTEEDALESGCLRAIEEIKFPGVTFKYKFLE